MLQWASLVAQGVKNLLAMRETWVQSLGWEDPLEEVMAIHSSILVWRIPMDRVAWQSPWDHKKSDTTEKTKHNVTKSKLSLLTPHYRR